MLKIFVFKLLQSFESIIAQQIQSIRSCSHTLPSLLKNFSTSVEVTLVDKPVTYKLFPGLVASTDWLLEQEKQDSYSTYSTELEPKYFGLNKAKVSQTINFQNVTSFKKKTCAVYTRL